MYVIDSGINRFHIEFGGLNSRATIGADFVGGNGTDCNGHGTHVSGTVGGTTYGAAKGVFIVAVRVFGCGLSSPASTVIAGINWVSVNRAPRSVANLSLGGALIRQRTMLYERLLPTAYPVSWLRAITTQTLTTILHLG